MVRKFECENCGKVSEDVYYDEDFGGALCSKCISTKNEWMPDEQPEPLSYVYTMLSNGRWVYRNTKTGRFVSRDEVIKAAAPTYVA